ncbi:hypothetical protein EVAR_61170_1 [Eumeta japonica]|uniref:Uncharacterized protein n=1 Tax=Eumeta variegata TaxID=151549 RepID=A0A4C1ZR84_EUMVA|nr:hypothetical protein EVAR_61170_1 [Eumeta japonica]
MAHRCHPEVPTGAEASRSSLCRGGLSGSPVGESRADGTTTSIVSARQADDNSWLADGGRSWANEHAIHLKESGHRRLWTLTTPEKS